MEEEYINVTLYSMIGDSEMVLNSIKECFQDYTKKILKEDEVGEEIQLTLQLSDNSEIQFFINTTMSFVEEHNKEMAAVFMQPDVEGRLEEIQNEIVKQILSIPCIVGCVFSRSEDEDVVDAIGDLLFDVINELCGYILFPSMQLMNGRGELVFSIEGESELHALEPVVPAVIPSSGINMNIEDINRRQKTISHLKKEGIPYDKELPCIVPEKKAKLRTVREIAQRFVSVYALAVYSEIIHEEEDVQKAVSMTNQIDYMCNGMLHAYLSPAEREFLHETEPDERDMINFIWRYEDCEVFLWVLGYRKELDYPNVLCDVEAIGQIIWNMENLDTFIHKAVLRDLSIVLDQGDINLQYDWACKEARLNRQDCPGELEGGVVFERHYSINWLVGANNDADWDDIEPTT